MSSKMGLGTKALEKEVVLRRILKWWPLFDHHFWILTIKLTLLFKFFELRLKNHERDSITIHSTNVYPIRLFGYGVEDMEKGKVS